MRRLSSIAQHLNPSADIPAAGPAAKVPLDQQHFLDTFRGLTKDLTDELTSKVEAPFSGGFLVFFFSFLFVFVLFLFFLLLLFTSMSKNRM